MEYLTKIRAFVDANLKKVMALVAGASVVIGAVAEYLTKIIEATAK